MSYVDDIWTNLQKVIPGINTSSTGIIQRIADVCGTFMDVVRLELLRSEQAIDQATRRARVTSESYYVDVAYKYQEGDDLIIVDQSTQELGYAEIDTTKQIIKQANIGVANIGIFYINVATSDANDNIVSLTTDQLNAFRSYYQNFVAMGAQVNVASNPPAVFTASTLYIRYERTYSLDAIKEAVNTALHELQIRKRTTNLLYVNEIEAYLKLVPGIRDAYFDQPTVIVNGITQQPDYGRFILQPGYFNFDPALYDFSQTKTQFEEV